MDGTHYQRSCNDWLARLDASRTEVHRLFVASYGERDADRWIERWRLFLMTCAELFGLDDGAECGVVHSLIAPSGPSHAR